MKLTDQEYEYWVRYSAAKALIIYPNGHVNSARECAEYADRMILELRKRNK